MRKQLIILCLLLLFITKAFPQIQLIRNGDFSQINYAWIKSGNFYYDSRFMNCNSCPGYAYLSNADGSPGNNINGDLSQQVAIPSSSTSAIFSFYYSITTQETTTNIQADKCAILLTDAYTNEILWSDQLSNLDKNTGYQSRSVSLPSSVYGKAVNVRFLGATNANNLPTTFRIDDVSLIVTIDNGTNSGCVTWTGGTPSNSLTTTAAEYLCQHNIISNYQNVSDLAGYSIGQAATIALWGIYNGHLPDALPTDSYPLMITDISQLPFQQYQAIKALCYLEGTDGRPCIKRDFLSIGPSRTISCGLILQILLEGWNFIPDTSGFNIYTHSPSSFLSNILADDSYYGYYKRANSLGLLSGYVNGNTFSQPSPGEFLFVMLYRLLNTYGPPSISTTSYYVPNNFSPQNTNSGVGILRAVFSTYEQDGFNIPSGGIGLHFGYSYHSDLIDFPYIMADNSGRSAGNLENHLAILHDHPLGKGWTYSYNIYAQVAKGVVNTSTRAIDDRYIVFHWGDGSINLYDVTTHAFTSRGIYDSLHVDAFDSYGHITGLRVITKEHVTTTFYRDLNKDEFQCSSIVDRNGNSINLSYELANCGVAPGSCVGTSGFRLKYVTDSYSGRQLEFFYQSNTDLISEVHDNTNRSIKFYSNKLTYTLDSVTNAKGFTTKYTYGSTDTAANLLVQITRPRGNTIKNNYAQRKLKQTSTPTYATTVSFSTSYTATAISTSSAVTYSPTNGTQYTTSYSHDSLGNITTVVSNTTKLDILYQDALNPNQPTVIHDYNTNILKSYVYDSKGNTIQYIYSAIGGHFQIERYSYDTFSNVLTHTWPNGTILNYTYDFHGNRIKDQGPLGYLNTYVINPNGTLQNTQDANNKITRFAYNSYGNINSITIDGTSIALSAVYDPVSRITKTTDGNGAATTYVYDNNDNVTRTIIDSGQLSLATTYSFDPNDNLSYVIAPRGDTTLLTYSSDDDLIQERHGKHQRSWTYNADGTFASHTDKRNVQFGYQYFGQGDPNEGKLITDSYSIFNYDATTRLLKSVTDAGTQKKLTYAYDPFLRINNVQFDSSSLHSEVAYTYDDLTNKIIKITLPQENKSISYEYDALNRPYRILDFNNNPIVTYYYYDNGLPYSENFDNGLKVYYVYDAANRVDSIFSWRNDASRAHAVGCSMDNNGNHTRESFYVQWNGSIIPNPVSDSSATYQYSYYNTLVTQNGNQVVSDSSGNTLRNDATGMNPGSAAGYDFRNNLTSITVDGRTRTYKYDGLENRFYNDSLRYTIDYVNNGNVLAIKKGGITQQLFVYSPNGSLVCSIDPNTAARTYYLYDFRGSTVATVDDNAKVTQYYKYDPFGTVTESSVTPGSATPFLFVGKYGVMYESSHVYFMRARYYDPTIGRFLGEDPKWNTNLFTYAGNNPLGNIDPNGNSAYKPAPADRILPGFPNSGKGKYNKESGRIRWKDGNGDILEWDKQHGEVEKYGKSGNDHKGGFDPNTGEQVSDRKPGRTTNKSSLLIPNMKQVITITNYSIAGILAGYLISILPVVAL